jgi:hypothetical protein
MIQLLILTTIFRPVTLTDPAPKTLMTPETVMQLLVTSAETVNPLALIVPSVRFPL